MADQMLVPNIPAEPVVPTGEWSAPAATDSDSEPDAALEPFSAS